MSFFKTKPEKDNRKKVKLETQKRKESRKKQHIEQNKKNQEIKAFYRDRLNDERRLIEKKKSENQLSSFDIVKK